MDDQGIEGEEAERMDHLVGEARRFIQTNRDHLTEPIICYQSFHQKQKLFGSQKVAWIHASKGFVPFFSKRSSGEMGGGETFNLPIQYPILIDLF